MIMDSAGIPLASADIIAASQERMQFARWAGAREYVHTLYGQRAARAEVNMFSRYNDSTYDREMSVDVYDPTGRHLVYDLRLPWWQRFGFSEEEIARYTGEHYPAPEPHSEYETAYSYEVNSRAQGEMQRLATMLLGADFIATRNEQDADTVGYDLTQQPLLRYPHLWTRDGTGA
jgi:hypothetical protein